ncbi:tripartite tricarboxylate transporter permease [Acuticoccus sp. M5D2P5]|uniref:tripartite tricarboxylate transporter permease n=1 Tax=Acuticoccus kalidii TaxID=2910977 RepID=UPI001F2B5FA1|nr:tripartite tricarboxylate transporter permease [Acuticoccus kalidii]MCF3936158.1 tripartite tricarboxylate transporter permease [Acuticoccus kalidii]
MEAFDGLLLVLSPDVLPFLILGVAVGMVFGALPGLDATTGIALLLPVTYAMEPVAALVFFSALYVGGVFAGSITAILFRTPGSSEAIMTAIEGHQFTMRGEARIALSTAVYCSAIGGLLASVALFLITPFLASVALKFGPAEYFALGLVGISCIAAITADNPVKGAIAALIGLLLATVGIDQLTGVKRFDFQVTSLLSGVPFVPAIIGLFAASEVYRRIAVRETRLVSEAVEGSAERRTRGISLIEFLRLRWTILRSSVIGLCVGILPGAGATTAAILGYAAEVRMSRDRSGFGKGRIEGVAAPESANNAATVGAMIPLLSLGIPGSGTTAVMMGAFLIHNLQPGPFLFLRERELVYGLFSGIALSNALILALAFIFIRLFTRLTLVPYPVLATGILSIAVAGSLAYGDTTAVMIMLIFAVLGLALEAGGYPLAPVVLGLVLGPIVETSMRRALLMSDFDPFIFVESPIAAGLILIALAFFVGPLIAGPLRRLRAGRGDAPGS